MEGDDPSEAKQMRLRYAGTCIVCATALPARTAAIYDPRTKAVRCLECQPSAPEPAATGGAHVRRDLPASEGMEVLVHAPEPQLASPKPAGTAGASARREFERRKARRDDRVRAAHPKIGGLILALTDDPQSTRAWSQGAVGEERLGARLDSLTSEGVEVLHDRRIVGTRSNIDHIAVTSNGVWVVDAKRYKGRPMLRVEGGILRPRVERLLVGGRDCTKLVDGVTKQVALVSDALAGEGIDAPVKGALAFVDADWPLIGGSFSLRRIHVLWPKRLAKLLMEPGEVEEVTAIHAALALRFPPACR